jgi:hypothetical protein
VNIPVFNLSVASRLARTLPFDEGFLKTEF